MLQRATRAVLNRLPRPTRPLAFSLHLSPPTRTMSTTPAPTAPPVPGATEQSTQQPAGDVPLDANGQPLTKSALKRLQKEKDLAAKKALKQAQNQGKPAPAAQAGEGKKKEKPAKKEEVVEEPPYGETQDGDKKDLSRPMAAGYNPDHVEKSWYSWWRSHNFFVPAIPSSSPSEFSHFDANPQFVPREGSGDVDWSKIDPEKTFVIPAPPPNVTGSLHIGHALAFGLQDTLIRWHRMRGYTTLFVPGYDHAGISTQSVVEKRLAKLEGLSRHDLGREKFLERCMAWKEEYQTRITNQICRLGVSCDWDRVAFTMNPQLSKAVAETFVRLHDDGIIYRANRLVNWCVAMNTTLSNLEVDQKVLTGRTQLPVPGYDPKEKFEFGVITSFAYPLEGSDEKIVIATTRPETLLGDTAIAVHPDDERYKHLHGKYALHPFLDRRLPIITDSIAVDMSFGTGAVKMTPAHDPNDYEVGMRHKLDFINILNDDGTLNANAGPEFEGMKRFHARKKVVEEMKKKGLYVGDAENPMSIPVCSKSGDFIESVMKPQWWVSCKALADKAIERTKAGELKIRPAASEGDWYRWLEGIQDWCISRQLWWGHRAPAYFVNLEGEAADRMNNDFWVSGRDRAEAESRAAAKFPNKQFTLEQDDDVLDTWFSSGLWPFSIQGWPDKTPDLEHFYPSSLLETGWDILFFWVARMVLLGIYLTGQVPFSEVFCHAMIRDAHGRKMSKSLGNVIDPIDVIEGASLEALHAQLRTGNLAAKEVELAEKGQKKDFPNGIPQCGTDALRFALANYSSTGRDINLEILRVEGYRKFCNKLWNATKFAMLKLEGDFVPPQSEKPTGQESLAEKWILHKLNLAAGKVNAALHDRNFMSATSDAYAFWLYEICDVYIEAIKLITDPAAKDVDARRSAQNTLYTVLDNGLRLLHPFMPFVTEELWQRLPRRATDQTQSIMLAKFPEASADRDFPEAEKEFDLAFNAVRAIRSMATSYNLNSKLQVFLLARNADYAATLRKSTDAISVLIKGCTSFTIVEKEDELPEGCVGELVSQDLTAYLLLKGVIDANAEIAKSEKRLAFAQGALQKLEAQRSAPNYAQTRPENVQAREAAKVDEWKTEIDALEKAIAKFEKLRV
ncbi:Valine--tRNA ligase, mitochondrial [Rhodotorula toruloides]|uniref:Valine--tRNA ligase, mitochondrial n=1 Tax=Rhodotorula toruloides TaxID=5286 RepID=A0A2T0A3L0_RHOTO|nr:Valine--tRNA ligase, mitochondrial [Rhodotorula toruloides]PRQ72604.1 valine-tRNA ligase [Rhodotorula toruloides]